MFYALNKRHLELLLATAFITAILLTPLALLRSLLQQESSHKVSIELSEYIEKNQLHLLLNQGTSIPIYDLEQTGALDFIRINLHGKSVTITNQKNRIEFAEILSLPWDKSLSWQKLIDGRSWSSSSIKLGPELTIQAGAIANEAELYKIIKKYYLIGLLLAAPLILLALQRLQHRSSAAIRQLARDLESQDLKESSDESAAIRQKIIQINNNSQILLQTTQSTLDNIAHDLRTPLARLRATAEYALRENEPTLLQAALVNCLEESQHISEILRVMMSVAEAEAGTINLEIREESLQKSLQDSIELYHYVAEEKEISVQLKPSPEQLANIDPTRIRQVWANLLDNAIKYGKIGGRVDITCHSTEESHIIDFTDNGTGIAPYETEKIWERLYRGDRSRTEKGLGLGLNYAKAVIDAHGGKISLQSTLHQGSCFTVILPRTTIAPLAKKTS